jgi:hypothetical protein
LWLSCAGASRFLGLKPSGLRGKYSMANKQVYTTSNAPASRNGNYSVKLDFSKGSRGIVTIKGQPERTTFTEKQRKSNFKK